MPADLTLPSETSSRSVLMHAPDGCFMELCFLTAMTGSGRDLNGGLERFSQPVLFWVVTSAKRTQQR